MGYCLVYRTSETIHVVHISSFRVNYCLDYRTSETLVTHLAHVM